MRSSETGSPILDRFRDEDGVTLIEVMVAILLLVTAFMAMAQVATTGLYSLRSTADRTTAVDLSTQAVEAARNLPWRALAMDVVARDAQCGTIVDIDVAGTLSELALCQPSAGVADQLPFWGQDGRYDLETYVTRISGVPNARRVTAVVRWEERGRQREVRTSNVIAAVERG